MCATPCNRVSFESLAEEGMKMSAILMGIVMVAGAFLPS